MAASDNTAALVVALSAQLTKFEKDMKGAVDIAKKRTTEIETTFAKMNKTITSQLSSFASGFGSQLGGLGSALARIGPVGGTVAAVLGAVTLGLIKAVDATNKWVEELGRLKDASETLGLTATQLHALERAGVATGNSAEQITQFITRFVGGLEKMKDGEGEVFNTLRKLNIEFVKQMNAAKTTAEAIDVLAKAFASLKTESEQIELTKAVGGKGGAALGRLLTAVTEAGGFENLTRATKNIDEQAKKYDAIADRVAQIRKDTDKIWGSMFTAEILEIQEKEALAMQALAKMVDEVQKAARQSDFATWIKSTFGDLVSKLQQLAALRDEMRMDEAGMVDPRTGRIAGAGGLTGTPSAPIPKVSVPLPLPRPAALKEKPPELTTGQEIAQLKELIGILGDAVTIQEQYRLKRLEIKKLAEDGKFKDAPEAEARAIQAAIDAQKASIAATREKLGISTEEQIVEAKVAQARKDGAAAQLTAIEIQKAENIARKEAIEIADKLAERRARFPGLQQLQNDIKNTDKEIDKFLVGSLSNLENAFIDAASGTKTLADAFRDMVSSILKDLARLLIRQSVTGPLASLIGGAFQTPVAHSGGVVGKTGFPMRSISPGAFVGAKHFQSGGMVGGEVPIIAHRGEIVGWPDQLRKAFGSDGGVSVVNQIVVQGDASENTVKLIRSELSAYARGEPDRVIRAVRQARERNVKL